MKKILLLVALCFASFQLTAQRNWEAPYNRIGIKAGANNFMIITENLPIEPKTSWTAGFTMRSSFYESFQLIYGLNFYDLNVSMAGREKLPPESQHEEIKFNMPAVQVSLMGSVKILDHRLSVEAGPVVQVNGKLEPQQNKELYYIEGYNFQAKDLAELNTFNFNIAAGVSGGLEQVKFWAQFQYGLNNMLNKLNNQGISEVDPTATNLQGNMRIISGGVIFFL